MADARIYTAAQEVLTEVVAGFATAGVTLPSRQLVHASEVAYDCELVCVEFTRIFHGFPGNEQLAIKLEIPRTVAMAVHIVRCIPTMADDGEPPSVTELQAAANTAAIDAWTLTDAVVKAKKTGALFPTNARCLLAGIGAVDFTTPQGGFGAVVLELAVQV